MTKEFISRKTAGSFQKPNSQFAPRPFATPQQKSALGENSTLQNVQCSPESSDRLSRIAIAQPEPFTPQLTVQRAEQTQVAKDNPGEEAEKIQRSSTGNNRLGKISIQPPEPPSTPRFPIQAKLTIGAAGDKYEQEADQVARQVVNRIQAPQVNFQSSESNPVQRKISIQALGGEGGDVSSEWESELNRARGGGQPLSPSLREPMEREFGADFSGVRVHTGAQADGLARSIQVKAFTTGQDVFFGQGAYEPGSRGGQELIAHELTHVVQQTKEENIQRTPEEDMNLGDIALNTASNYYSWVEPQLIEYRKFILDDLEQNDKQGAFLAEKMSQGYKAWATNWYNKTQAYLYEGKKAKDNTWCKNAQISAGILGVDTDKEADLEVHLGVLNNKTNDTMWTSRAVEYKASTSPEQKAVYDLCVEGIKQLGKREEQKNMNGEPFTLLVLTIHNDHNQNVFPYTTAEGSNIDGSALSKEAINKRLHDRMGEKVKEHIKTGTRTEIRLEHNGEQYAIAKFSKSSTEMETE
ncbi:DUF4157 domain-containing protein [Oscillatoria sp. HE19RPO]|uniref:eCIS core domain-containing protein n=1 Tax=Oscillatoria sp. HE19RPO TaxID=2954806 RepID=UPI0020C385A2|nr:DUF4157 domain-containing protein [Oscillatoria sp. HE19RPO]